MQQSLPPTRPRRVIRALLAVSLLTLLLSTSVADTLYSQIQGKSQQLNGVNGAITATKTHVQQLLDQEAALQRQIAGLDANLAQVAQQIRQETAALVALAAQVEQAKRDLAVKEAQLKKHILDFGLRMRAMYKTGEVNPLELILSAQSFTDLLNRTVFFAAVIRESRIEVVKLQAERAAVEAMKADLDAKYAQQAAIVKQIKDQQAQLQVQRAQRAQAEAQVAAIVAEFRQQLAQMEAQRATLKNQLQALIAESARAGSTGHFIWPMQGAITQGFGCTSYPFEPYDPGCPGGHFHSGIDIGTDAGTPVHASDAGIVHNYTMACGGYLCGYGQYVLVVHSAGFVSLYGHLSGYGQADGTAVGQGTVIGYEGSTGNSTGPHLHFEIDLNGTPVSPFAYLP
ncbi:MAG: peptidoglycan DD-metalloendopeptidase family protein [Candidatus Dormibacteraeota bacterium]|nr:peptidoglycan DD-metalloendopeptidase family protein [Candidatus Dormibacteraeota bacterium]